MIKTIYIIAFFTIVRKEMKRLLRIWRQTLIPPIITMILYFLIFGHILGRQIGRLDGFTYIQYIAPGLIMMNIITNAYTNVVSSFFFMRFDKSVQELLVAPIPNYLILLGFMVGGILRSLLVGLLVTIVALFFTHLYIHSFIVIFSIVLLSAILFSLAGFTNSLLAKKIDEIMTIPTFILTPLNYLGGIFFPLYLLHSPWYEISFFNPILYMVNAFRFGILGISDVPLISAFSILIVCIILLFTFNLHLLRKGIGIRT